MKICYLIDIKFTNIFPRISLFLSPLRFLYLFSSFFIVTRKTAHVARNGIKKQNPTEGYRAKRQKVAETPRALRSRLVQL